jgi:hypothetical protein
MVMPFCGRPEVRVVLDRRVDGKDVLEEIAKASARLFGPGVGSGLILYHRFHDQTGKYKAVIPWDAKGPAVLTGEVFYV